MALAEWRPPDGGWIPDVPDPRDWRPGDTRVQRQLEAAGIEIPARRPRRISLREWFTPVLRPAPPGEQSAQAVLDVVEYWERRAHGTAAPRSAEFLGHVARRLEGRGPTDAIGLRSVLKTLKRFGAPPAHLDPASALYSGPRLADPRSTRPASTPAGDRDPRKDSPDGGRSQSAGVASLPDPFLYGFQREFRRLFYVRLDTPGDGETTLDAIRAWVAAGIPCLIGFSVPSSLTKRGDIPYRPRYDRVIGGATAVVVGYDDNRLCSTKGALRIRSPWGPAWGHHGYGWLPYYALKSDVTATIGIVMRKYTCR